MTAIRTGTIRQRVEIPASPAAVYRTLMTSAGHRAFTGAPARISGRVGGSFTAWGGYIHGRNLELVVGKRIVQAWVPAEASWPEGHESKVTYRLSPSRNGTRISFTHSAVPREHVGHLSSGWKESYWDPLRRYFTRAEAKPRKTVRRAR
ncbi:MAG TPA: SRPBCC domain-containing protein [Thermoplasmata archaeon]|nr:SRPBCC domain-containing protein [Thermoplasmata archaeon]HEV2428791.1 SRPBCC domain-containing protein [Thermoplasmata archaeon]